LEKRNNLFFLWPNVYRGREAHLFGRCHIDVRNAIKWKDYGMAGTLESARVTTLPIEQASRVSPGSGISAMQMITHWKKTYWFRAKAAGGFTKQDWI
jgi:DNA polymerase-2